MIDSPVLEIKKRLAAEIVAIADQTNFFVAARGLGLGTARLSDLRRGRVERFTIDRLVRALAVVDRRVDVSVTVVGRRDVEWFAEGFRRQRERRAAAAAAAAAEAEAEARGGDSALPIARFGKRFSSREQGLEK